LEVLFFFGCALEVASAVCVRGDDSVVLFAESLEFVFVPLDALWWWWWWLLW